MNPVQTLFHLPWIARLGWTLLHFLWQGSLIAALLALVRARWGARTAAPLRYAAACAALAAMGIAPLVTFVVLSNADAPSSAATVAAAAAQGAGMTWPVAASPSWANVWERVSPWLGAAWVVGVMLCLLRLAGGWLLTARLRTARSRPAPAEWQANLAALRTRLGVARPVRLLVSSLVETPAVMGWLRPVILVPVGALAGLPTAQVEALVAHELAHIRRHDYLVNLLQSLAEAVLFYHPAVWWVSRVIRAEREYCCDDLAVAAAGGDVLTYARALAEMESGRRAHALAMAASGGSLRNRIRRLVDPSPAGSHSLPSGAAAGALGAILLISAGALAVRAAASPAPPQEPVVDSQSIWPDTVKFGDLVLEVRALGTITSATTAEVKLAPVQAASVIAGQPAKIEFRPTTSKDIVAGLVEDIRPGVSNGVVTADITLTAPLPSGVDTGEPIDSSITTGQLTNVLHVARPVFAPANSTVTLFRLEPDGQHANRVRVQFGRVSVNQIEIKSGLNPGDKVILSDMRAYDGFDRIAVK